MNITIAKRNLIYCVEREYTLSYSEGKNVEEGDVIQVCGTRYMTKGVSDWRIDDIYPEDEKLIIGESVDEDIARQQLILKMTVDDISNRKNTVSNISTVDRSEIVKNKEYILNTVIQLWHIGWNTKYIGIKSHIVIDIDEPTYISENIRPIDKIDFKITTVSSQSKSMHLGHTSATQDYSFKLGVNWVYWHRMSPTERLKVLTHELCHCKHSHHKESFFREHAKFISSLVKSEERKERVESLFNGKINWNELKTKTMHGVHNQPKEIDISGHPHRRAACNSVIEGLEDILNYKYEVGNMFYIHPPDKLYVDWQYNTLFNNEELKNLEEVHPENVHSEEVRNLNYNDNYTDEELFTYLNSIRTDTHSVIMEYVFPDEDIPHIDDENNVVKNDKLVALYNRMITDTERKGLSQSVEILVKHLKDV